MVLDIVAVSVFDFLIGNGIKHFWIISLYCTLIRRLKLMAYIITGDRHHFEMYADPDNESTLSIHSKSILLIDNGKR